MNPGVNPPKATVAFAVPICADFDAVAKVSTVSGAGVPSATAGDTGPDPVRYATMVLPPAAGGPASLRLKSAAFCTIAAPPGSVKSPGAAVCTGTSTVL